MKKRFMILFMLVIAMVATVFGVAACGGGTSSNGITLSETEVSLEVGETKTITATYSGSDTLTWASGDTSIATVTQLANAVLVKGVAEGSTTITATAGEYTATCNVTVTAAVTYTISLDGNAVTTAEVERTKSITLTATASDGSEISYWASADSTIATVENGVVTGVMYGTTTIYAGKDSSHCGSITLDVVAAEGTVAYVPKLTGSEETGDADDTWYYWNEWGQSFSILYENGDLTVSFINNAGDWCNIQLLYTNSELTNGNAYILSFNVNTTTAGHITVNGIVFDLAVGDNTISAPYLESANSTSASIQLGVQDGNILDIVEGTLTFSDIKWTETTTETLATPSFTVENDVITINDTNDASKVGYYLLYLYDENNNLCHAVAVENGMKISELDTSAVTQGTYTAYLKAFGVSEIYYTSANSSTSTTINVTSDPSYTLSFAIESKAVANVGTWFYWNKYWAVVSNNTYADGTVNLTFSNNAGFWYDTQLFYKNPTLTEGTTYKLTFILTSTAAGTITVNGKVVSIVEGENEISVTYTEGSSSSVSIQFGTSANGTDITAATVSLTGFTWEEGQLELASINNGGQADAIANSGYWFYWNDLNYVSSYTEVTYASYENGTLVITYTITPWTNQTAPWYAVQLFYENGNLTAGETYILTLTITSTTAGSITVNGIVYELDANVAKEISIAYTESSGSASISIQMGVQSEDGGNLSVIDAATITVTDVTFTDSEGNVIDNGEGAGTNTGDSGSGSGEDTSAYTVLVDTLDTESTYDITHAGETEANADPGTIYVYYVGDYNYWGDWAAVENTDVTATYANGTITWSTKNEFTSDYWWANQLFYKNSTLTIGTTYLLTLTIVSNAAGSITVNGTVINLVAGTNDIKVVYTESSGASLSIQLGVYGSATNLTAPSLTISNINWYAQEATSGGDSGDTGDDQGETYNAADFTVLVDTLNTESTYDITHGEESVATANTGTVYVWYIGDYEYWSAWAAVENTDVTANYANGTITWSTTKNATYGSTYHYANQLFYKNSALTSGTTYMLTLTINSSVATSITINGTVVNLAAGENSVTVFYTEGSGASISIQLGVAGTGSDVDEISLTMSNINWYAQEATSGGTEEGGDSGSGTEEGGSGTSEATVLTATYQSFYNGNWITVDINTTLDLTTSSGLYTLYYNGSAALASDVFWYGDPSNGVIRANIMIAGETVESVPETITLTWYDSTGTAVATTTFSTTAA